jgi:hypothetical protein
MLQAIRRVLVRSGIIHASLEDILDLIENDELVLSEAPTTVGDKTRYTGENRHLEFVLTREPRAEVLQIKLPATGDHWIFEFMENRTSHISLGMESLAMTTIAKAVAQHIYREVWQAVLLNRGT